MQRLKTLLIALLVLMMAYAWAADDDIARLYTFSAGQIIQSSQINGEYNQIITALNGKMSRAGVNTVSGNNTFSGANTFSGINTFTSATTPIKTDKVDEYTSAAGVTIDSVRLKDGMAKVSGTPASGGEIGYASNRLQYHNGTSVITLPDVGAVSSVVGITSSPSAGDSAFGTVYLCTSTFTFGITDPAAFRAGWHIWVRNEGTGVITIDPAGAVQIDQLTTIKVYPGEAFMITKVSSTHLRTVGRGKTVHLSSQTASNSTSLDFELGLDDTEFAYIEFILTDILPASDGATLWGRVKDSTYQADASDYMWSTVANYVGTTDPTASSADSEVEITRSGQSPGNATNEGYSGQLTLHKPSSSSHKWMSFRGGNVRTDGSPANVDGFGKYIGSTNAITGLRFLFSTGNITSGTITARGVRN
jgi:hypothetical protein